jgi:hypothetical protein
MKKLTFLLISVFVSLLSFAGEVTEQDALQKAQQFMKGKQFKQMNLHRAPSMAGNAYYVFNAEDGGFVIVSGDDRTAEILGYSETGVFDWGKAPSNVKWLLNFYKQFIDHLGTNPTQARSSDTPVSASDKKTITSFVKTQWGQFAPYNNQCPELNGERCATGCVATAMAQIINYCKWPQEQTGTVAAYQTGTEKINMSQLSPTSFDWDHMQEADIARLMLYCGQSVQMDYGIVESGAMVEDAPFKDVFGYSKSVRIISRDVMYSEWENILYDELANNRPILYKGGNHAWVIDGYKDGLFHMNWGWDGDLDGYYKITDLTEDDFVIKYEWNQSALIGILPPSKAEDTSAKVIVNSMGFATETIIDNIGYLKRTTTSEDFPVVNISSELYCDLPSVQEVGIGLLDSKGVLRCFAQGQHDFSNEEQPSFSQEISFGKDLADGDYRLVAICRNGETGDWLQDIEANCSYIEVHIEGLDMTLHIIPDGRKSKDYRAVGVKEIDGVTYFLYYDNENYLATVYPYQISEKYAGKVVIPKEVEYEGTTYRVFDENNAFTDCPELTSLTLNNSFITNIANCPKLTNLNLQEGVAVCYGVKGLPLLENIELPATLNWTMGNSFITDCEKLKTIRFKGTVFNILYEIPKWDDSSLPALTDIYFPNTTPPLIIDQGTNEQITDIVPAHTKARIHIPVGSLPLYQQSNWKNWTFVEDMPAPSAVTWGYCHGDAVMNSGSGEKSNSNYMEYAMRVPADKISVYKGAKITQIQLYSQWATRNDYHLEDYEYVYITKRGTDYIVKQPFNVVRGAWNTIELETPYTITGEEIFVGFGRYQGINVVYSDMTEVKDAAWGRAMGDDYGCIWEPGVWQKLGTRAHPLPLRFVIEGEGISEGVSVGELNIIESTSGEMSRKASSTGIKLQATVRNMSLQPVSSYTLEWSVDGEVKGNKSFETYLVPNASEFVTLDLPASYSSDTHTISLDIKTVNGTSNELADKNVACMEVINGEEGVILTAKDCTREYGDSNPKFEFTTKSDLSGELPVITCEADKTSPVGTYPIVIQKGTIDYDNVSCVNGTLTIEKAPLTITAKDYTIKQGSALPTFEATYEGFKNDETEAVLTKKPSFTTTATSISELGEYEITVNGAEAQNYKISYINGTIKIVSFVPGDVNGDGVVNVTDIVATVNYIMEKPSDGFNKDAADLTGDGEINVTDIVKMVSIIMNGNGGSSRRAAATSGNLVISGHNIQLRNADNYIAAQFDINLSDGQSISSIVLNGSSNHELYWKMIDANICRVVVYSMTNTAFGVNGDNLFNIFMNGGQRATISNELLIKAGNTTGIDAIRTEAENGNVYDLNGRQVKTPRKGVYIINGRKVVVK